MFGVGLRTTHYSRLESNSDSQLDWFEILTENHLGSQGRPQTILAHLRQRYPFSFHGVSLNIASHEPLNLDYLRQLKRFADEYQPILISDHLCWTGLAERNLHNLLPIPYTPENLNYLARRIDQVQTVLERPLALENLSAYFDFKTSTLREWEFLAQLAQEADCKLLLDLNNIYVNACNHGFDARTYIDAIPADRIAQYHLAGYTDLGTHLFDTHSQAVYPDVWALYRYALQSKGLHPTLIEWDDEIPEFEVLEAEALKAKAIWQELQVSDV